MEIIEVEKTFLNLRFRNKDGFRLGLHIRHLKEGQEVNLEGLPVEMPRRQVKTGLEEFIIHLREADSWEPDGRLFKAGVVKLDGTGWYEIQE